MYTTNTINSSRRNTYNNPTLQNQFSFHNHSPYNQLNQQSHQNLHINNQNHSFQFNHPQSNDQFHQFNSPQQIHSFNSPQQFNQFNSNQYKFNQLNSNPSKYVPQNNYGSNFNSGWAYQSSKLDQINKKIAKTTSQILYNKSRVKNSQILHHKLLKQPQSAYLKYKKPYIHLQSPRQYNSKYNYGTKPIVINQFDKRSQYDRRSQTDKKSQKDRLSQSQKSRKTSMNYYQHNTRYPGTITNTNAQHNYEAIPNKQQKNMYHSSINYPRLESYRSTDLILLQNKDVNRKSSVKKQIKFNYISPSQFHNKNNPNTKSSISLYQPSYQKPTYTFSQQKFQSFNKFSSPQQFKPFLQDYTHRSPSSQIFAKDDQFFDMKQPVPQIKVQQKQTKIAQKQNKTQPHFQQKKPQPIQKIKVQTKILQPSKQNKIKSTFGQMKDKQSKLIAIALIIMALIIFFLQLIS